MANDIRHIYGYYSAIDLYKRIIAGLNTLGQDLCLWSRLWK